MLSVYDVIIVGAGPGGSAAALSLAHSGLRVALIDKAIFPRDKVCGDFIAGHGIRVLREISPNAYIRLINFPQKAENKSTLLFIGNTKPMEFFWKNKSYTIRRVDFDNLLVEEVVATKNIDFYPGHAIKQIKRVGRDFELSCQNGQMFNGHLIIGADGAHSVVARQLAGYSVDREHYGGSVRAYFKGVKNIRASANEVYVHKDVVPGYFWLFPVGDDSANVGIGMHSRHITKHKVDLKARFYDFIEQNPVLQSKLGEAQLEGSLQGFGLPFYSKEFKIHGDGYMLVGDAASLIDPSNGEGIMLAIQSGKMAAEQAIKALKQDNWSEAALAPYQKAVNKRWWKEMRAKAWMVNVFAHRYRVLYAVGWLGNQSPTLRRWLQKLM
ncbi:MAG: geranylgeranyl reductase family protein [Sphingobacteriaceae bacterium]|nr:geranylgeranyl reductase family protein [Sphingobacteriaceae bacterium]